MCAMPHKVFCWKVEIFPGILVINHVQGSNDNQDNSRVEFSHLGNFNLKVFITG